MRTLVTAAVLAAMLFGVAPHAAAFGGGGHRFFGAGGSGAGGGRSLPLRLLVAQMTLDQRQQVRATLMGARTEMHGILDQLRTAHAALTDKMLGPGTLTDADVAPLLQKLDTLHQQLLDQGAKVMLQVRAIATPDQLAKAAATKQQLDKLHDEMRSLMGGLAQDDEMPPME